MSRGLFRQFSTLFLLALGLIAVGTASVALPAVGKVCGHAGQWLDPASGQPLALDALIADLAQRRVVLLGEEHTAVEHHRWQSQILAALHAYQPKLAVGFEMLPRAAQPTLDAWSRGRLSERAFLRQSRWREVWGYDPALYMPLLRFARRNRLPTVALNVDIALIRKIGDNGWSAIPTEERAGLSDPAPASDAYRRSLAEVFRAKLRHRAEGEAVGEAAGEAAATASQDPPAIEAILERPDFSRFVEAQLTWDRAMAEALNKATLDNPGALVVGIIGRGHMEHGHGVPHQLADLGLKDAAVLLPVRADAACTELKPGLADAVFLVDPESAPSTKKTARPWLGVMIEEADGGVRIAKVVKGSIAEATNLVAQDVIVRAAGEPILFGAVVELIFSTLLAPVVSLSVTIFLLGLLGGCRMAWNVQRRSTEGLRWREAARGLWPQLAFGTAMLVVLASQAADALPWVAMLLVAFLGAIPFAVLTASPRLGRLAQQIRLCRIPEEMSFDRPSTMNLPSIGHSASVSD